MIAEAANCTRSTVSYALNNHPSISLATRKRVQSIANKLGWQPDLGLRQQMILTRGSLSKTTLPNIGVLINKPSEELERLYYTTERRHLDGVRRRSGEVGFTVNFFNLATDPLRPQRLAAILRARGIRGVVVVDPNITFPTEYWKLATEFAMVSVGVDPEGVPIHVAISDYLSIGRRVVRELLKIGFQRPGLVVPLRTEVLLNWGLTGGFHAGIAALPRKDQVPVCYGDNGELFLDRSTFPVIRAWIDEHKPDVVIGIDTFYLSECLASLPRHAHIPIFSVDWHPGLYAIGGIDQRAEEIGRAAVDLLVAQLSRAEIGLPNLKLKVLVEESWVGPSASQMRPGRTKTAAGRRELD